MAGIQLSITRSSVCAADDFDPPHEQKIIVSSTVPIRLVVSSILESGYLPTISGGKATWIIKADSVIGVAAQQWAAPTYCIN